MQRKILQRNDETLNHSQATLLRSEPHSNYNIKPCNKKPQTQKKNARLIFIKRAPILWRRRCQRKLNPMQFNKIQYSLLNQQLRKSAIQPSLTKTNKIH
jgi:hypothetical protein